MGKKNKKKQKLLNTGYLFLPMSLYTSLTHLYLFIYVSIYLYIHNIYLFITNLKIIYRFSKLINPLIVTY